MACQRLQTLLLLIAVGLLACLNWQFFQLSNHSMQTEIVKLNDTLQRFEKQLLGSSESEENKTGQNAMNDVEDPELDSKTVAEKLTVLLKQESVDATWADVTEIAFINSIKNDENFAMSRVTEAECRQTFCRVLVEHDNQAAADQFFEMISFVSPWDTNVIVHIERDAEKVIAIMFVSRQGHFLPE